MESGVAGACFVDAVGGALTGCASSFSPRVDASHPMLASSADTVARRTSDRANEERRFIVGNVNDRDRAKTTPLSCRRRLKDDLLDTVAINPFTSARRTRDNGHTP